MQLPRVAVLAALMIPRSMKDLVCSLGWRERQRAHWLRLLMLPKRCLAISAADAGDGGAASDGEAALVQRFWTRTVQLGADSDLEAPRSPPSSASRISAAEIVARVEKFLSSGKHGLPNAESALIVVPRHQLLIPVQSGVVQSHLCVVSSEFCAPSTKDGNSDLTLVVCGFLPRAQDKEKAFYERDRPVNLERLNALDAALLRQGVVTGKELVEPPFQGTPPGRIYRSFVCPHTRAKFTLEPVERAAERTAIQIELSIRQWRADQSQYLRNVDRTNLPDDAARSDLPVSSSNPKPKHPVVLVLDSVRSAFNVGSMFRSAETGGISELITCGITPHPPHPKLHKTALNAVENVPTRHFDNVLDAIDALRKEGYTIVAMETTTLSKDYTSISYPKKVALVVGNELTGVDARVLESADVIAEIPTYGVKNSLNVASAAPIMIFEVLRQWKANDSSLQSQR